MINDLEHPCARCLGTGWVMNPVWEEFWERYDKASEEEKRALRAKFPSDQAEVPCPNCDGRGLVLTEKGQKLYDFMRRWMSCD